MKNVDRQEIEIAIAGERLSGTLSLPEESRGVVLFAHGSGSSRHSPRNQQVARALEAGQMGTLLMDLLTPREEAMDAHTGHLRFDIGLLAERLLDASEWLRQQSSSAKLPLGYFGASTGAAAALVAAGQRKDVSAVVSRGGRPDLAGEALPRVQAPTLLIVGGDDVPVIELNERAMAQLRAKKRLVIIPGASHLFPEPGALEEVASLAREWFQKHLLGGARKEPAA